MNVQCSSTRVRAGLLRPISRADNGWTVIYECGLLNFNSLQGT